MKTSLINITSIEEFKSNCEDCHRRNILCQFINGKTICRFCRLNDYFFKEVSDG